MDIQKITGSLDLKAGQAVSNSGWKDAWDCLFPPDRNWNCWQNGVPKKKFSVKPVMKGCDCSLSGVENRCRFMLEKGERPEDVARYCLDFFSASLFVE